MITYCLLWIISVVLVANIVVPMAYAGTSLFWGWFNRCVTDPWKIYKWKYSFKDEGKEYEWSDERKYSIKGIFPKETNYLSVIVGALEIKESIVLMFTTLILSTILAIIQKYSIEDLTTFDLYLVITLGTIVTPFLLRFLLDLCKNLKHNHKTGESVALTEMDAKIKELESKFEKES